MGQFKVGEVTVDAGTTLLMAGSDSPHLCTVLSGMVTRSKTPEDGRRQVMNLFVSRRFYQASGGHHGRNETLPCNHHSDGAVRFQPVRPIEHVQNTSVAGL